MARRHVSSMLLVLSNIKNYVPYLTLADLLTLRANCIVAYAAGSM